MRRVGSKSENAELKKKLEAAETEALHAKASMKDLTEQLATAKSELAGAQAALWRAVKQDVLGMPATPAAVPPAAPDAAPSVAAPADDLPPPPPPRR